VAFLDANPVLSEDKQDELHALLSEAAADVAKYQRGPDFALFLRYCQARNDDWDGLSGPRDEGSIGWRDAARDEVEALEAALIDLQEKVAAQDLRDAELREEVDGLTATNAELRDRVRSLERDLAAALREIAELKSAELNSAGETDPPEMIKKLLNALQAVREAFVDAPGTAASVTAGSLAFLHQVPHGPAVASAATIAAMGGSALIAWLAKANPQIPAAATVAMRASFRLLERIPGVTEEMARRFDPDGASTKDSTSEFERLTGILREALIDSDSGASRKAVQALQTFCDHHPGHPGVSLNLAGTKVSDIGALSGLTNLQTLYLDGTQVSDVGALSGLTNLQWLDLTDTQVSDVGALAELPNLDHLFLPDGVKDNRRR
jgi:hypothetical protein